MRHRVGHTGKLGRVQRASISMLRKNQADGPAPIEHMTTTVPNAKGSCGPFVEEPDHVRQSAGLSRPANSEKVGAQRRAGWSWKTAGPATSSAIAVRQQSRRASPRAGRAANTRPDADRATAKATAPGARGRSN